VPFNHGPGFHSMVAEILPEHRVADVLIDAWTMIIDEKYES
jgi:hypothetical protein